jgi:hypothetical protein
MSTQLGDTTFGPLPRIEAGVLDVGYVEAGPARLPAPYLARRDCHADDTR